MYCVKMQSKVIIVLCEDARQVNNLVFYAHCKARPLLHYAELQSKVSIVLCEAAQRGHLCPMLTRAAPQREPTAARTSDEAVPWPPSGWTRSAARALKASSWTARHSRWAPTTVGTMKTRACPAKVSVGRPVYILLAVNTESKQTKQETT